MSLTDILKGKWLGHPLHPIFVHIPAGLWPAALIFDLVSISQFGGNGMVRLSFYCIALGLAATLFAIPTGLVDWSGIKKEKPAWKLGLYHMVGNLFVTALFAANLGLRAEKFQTAVRVDTPELVLSIIGTLFLFVSAYLGGLMVFDQGTSVARNSKKKWRTIAERGNANLPPDKEKQ
ncbi:MAG: DUF2231 domain-containing protein [Verrucomicrobia bacterium]|nr:DUF2231 domain-containing protein [Verrucomicrobiota bacterium]